MPTDDQHITGRLLFDDKKTFESIFKAYFPRLMAFAQKFVANRDIAEDIIQETFLKIWTNRKAIEESTFQSYLFTLVRNACLNHIKHRQIENNYLTNNTKGEQLYYADFFSDPFHQTIFREVQQKIEEVMQMLPEQTRKVFHLSRFEGMKNMEIAKQLQISLRTVEKHISRALSVLKHTFP
jgi:RNA polymerase sigma-70 factor (family 1)